MVWALVLSLLTAFVISQNVSATPAAGSPVEVTNALMHSALKNFGFTTDNLKVEKEWLTPDLYSRLVKKANQPTPKGDAPDIEGDVFLDCQDLPTSIVVGKSNIDHDKATVDVALKFGDEKRKYTVLLKQVDGAWKVYDINYEKDGSLTDLLK